MQTSTGEVRIVRHYAASADQIWRAWTDPQALMRWFGPSPETIATLAEIDLRVGGHYRIAFQSPDGEQNQVAGEYLEVQPQQRLVFNWAFHTTPERVSRVSITLTPVADGTELTFVHDRFVDSQARDNHERGWRAFFQQLHHYMEAL
jgi:uncharacterized protein YndB with AHSA1/START domain